MADDLFAVFEQDAASAAREKRKQPPTGVSAQLPTSLSGPDKYASAAQTAQAEMEGGRKTKQRRVEGTDLPDLPDAKPIEETISRGRNKDCTWEIAVPTGMDYKAFDASEVVEEPAFTYPFVLDPFQKRAIQCLEHDESVLVAAHTSAGKTVVAEYAIALALKQNQRVVYTSPIKALSNQKFREMQETFTDVGLMTGDVTINPEAACLVMTTEILRSMLYRGSQEMREVGWVIFDEVHYMRDKERGVVWEETIIMLPDPVRYVFLSATIPNAFEFAQWIANLHKQPCHVVYTDYRPTPLEHYVHAAGASGLQLVVDANGKFREDSLAAAMAQLNPNESDRSKAKKGKKGGTKGPSQCFKIVKLINKRGYHPCIVFSFSKRECEAYALQMSKIDFIPDERLKKQVELIFENGIASLSDDDKKLPQVEHVLPLFKRGIGIHHSGLLPILKEITELLFQEGLVKILFATETFAMGLNMPAMTCVFTSVRKFDGKDFRWISSGEYIQMSGRAGRRNRDKRGIVIVMVDEKLEPAVAKNLLQGQAEPLRSAFHLTYNMILNLMRVEDLRPEHMLERCFAHFQNTASLPRIEQKLKQAEAEAADLTVERSDEVEDYYLLRRSLSNFEQDMQAVMTMPEHIVPFLKAGRLVKVRQHDRDFGWGTIINFQKHTKLKSQIKRLGQSSDAGLGVNDSVYTVDVLLKCATGSKADGAPRPCQEGDVGELNVVPVTLPTLERISKICLYLPKDLKPLDARKTVHHTIAETHKRYPKGIPLLDPIKDMNIKDKAFIDMVSKIHELQGKLQAHAIHSAPNRDDLIAQYERKLQAKERVSQLKRELKHAREIQQMTELKHRKRVLRRLNFCSEDDVIQLKGRVACEISTGDELLLTELLFNGVFNELTVPQTVGLLSCFVCTERTQEARIREELAAPLRQLQDTARRIAKVSTEAKLPKDEEEYVQSFQTGMMDITFAWSTGAKFSEICKMTDIFEGSIIRAMRRLEELLRQMMNASKAIGNVDLENKFAMGIEAIKRDIVFAASLYL